MCIITYVYTTHPTHMKCALSCIPRERQSVRIIVIKIWLRLPADGIIGLDIFFYPTAFFFVFCAAFWRRAFIPARVWPQLGANDCREPDSYTQRNIFEILFNQTETRLYLPFSDWFGRANGIEFCFNCVGKWRIQSGLGSIL